MPITPNFDYLGPVLKKRYDESRPLQPIPTGFGKPVSSGFGVKPLPLPSMPVPPAAKTPINSLPFGMFGTALSLGQIALNQMYGDYQERKMNTDQFNNATNTNTVMPSVYAKHGYLNQDETQLAQVDKSEVMVLPDMSIVKPLSKKDHEDMEKKDITDVLPQGTYVASDKYTMTRAQAEKIKLGAAPVSYSESGNKGAYKEFKLSDLFGAEDKMTLAEMVVSLQKMIPVAKQGDDDYSKITSLTNEENRNARAKYLKEIILYNAEKNKDLSKPSDGVIKAKHGFIVAKNKSENKGFGMFRPNQYVEDALSQSVKTHKGANNNFGSLRDEKGKVKNYSSLEHGLTDFYADVTNKLTGRDNNMKMHMASKGLPEQALPNYQEFAQLRDLLELNYRSSATKSSKEKYIEKVSNDIGFSQSTKLSDIDALALMKGLAKVETRAKFM